MYNFFQHTRLMEEENLRSSKEIAAQRRQRKLKGRFLIPNGLRTLETLTRTYHSEKRTDGLEVQATSWTFH